MALDILGIGALASIPAALLLASKRGQQQKSAQLFFHVKNDPIYGPVTKGKVSEIYSSIRSYDSTPFNCGLQPQSATSWEEELEYLTEFKSIPTMLTVFASDNAYQMGVSQIAEAIEVCQVQYLRFHEVLAYYWDVLSEKMPYIRSVLGFARDNKIPVFWNEWNVNLYPTLSEIIEGYEDCVTVSFGTNCNWLEPVEGYRLLQAFPRKAASVQSWYWWERNNRVDGYELTMPPELMAQHTLEAFTYGCEVVQYEPYNYFFDWNAHAKSSLPAMFAAMV